MYCNLQHSRLRLVCKDAWLTMLLFGVDYPRADPGFSWGGGGGAKDDTRSRTSRARSPKSFTAGVQGPLKGPGSSSLGFLMLSRAILAIFLIILIQHGILKTTVYLNLGGVACCPPPPPGSVTVTCNFQRHWPEFSKVYYLQSTDYLNLLTTISAK